MEGKLSWIPYDEPIMSFACCQSSDNRLRNSMLINYVDFLNLRLHEELDINSFRQKLVAS